MVHCNTSTRATELEYTSFRYSPEAVMLNIQPIKGHKELDLTNTSMVSDNSGYLWIGTQSGLVRLDGYKIKQYTANLKSKTGLIGNFVNCLAFDRASNLLWIGTTRGLSVLDLQTNQFLDLKISQSLSDNLIQSLFVDSRNNVWIGTSNGLNRYDQRNKTVSVFHHQIDDTKTLSDSNILDVNEDSAKNIWIATAKGLNRWRAEDEFERYTVYLNPDASSGLVNKIAIDSNDKLWLGTEHKGLILFDPDLNTSEYFSKRENYENLPSDHIRTLMFDKSGTLWVGTRDGLAIFSPLTKRMINLNSLEQTHDNIVSLYQDSSDVIWIGTWSNGLLQNNPNKTNIGKLDLAELRTEGNVIKSILKGEGTEIWVANSKHLYNLNAVTGLVYQYELSSINPKNIRVNQFYNSQTNDHYLLTDKVFLVDPPVVGEPVELPSSIENASWYGAMVDWKGRVWLSSRNRGIFVLSSDFKEVIKHTPSSLSAYVHQINESTIVAGTHNEALWIDSETLAVTSHKPENAHGMLHPNITGYLQTSENGKWLATSGGIHQLIGDPSVKTIYKTWTTQDGLPTDVLTGPLEDLSGSLWFSSVNGLVRFNPKSFVIEHFDEKFGSLPNYYIGQYIQGADNKMYFLGPNGLSIIDSKSVKNDRSKPDLIIDELKINGAKEEFYKGQEGILKTSIQFTNELILDPDKRNFSFLFTTGYNSEIEKMQYVYRLLGYNENWISSDWDNRSVSYTNLSPGDYRFEAMVISPKGVQSDVRSIGISIRPFFVESIWFKILSVVLISSLILSWFRYRIYRIQQDNLLLEKEVEFRTQDIKTLANIGRDISAILNINELVEQLYIHINKSLIVDALALGIYEPENNRIKFERGLERNKIIPTHYRDMNSESELAAWCMTNRQEVLVRDSSEIYRYLKRYSGPVIGEQMETVIYEPIYSRSNKMLGCITVQSSKKNCYNQQELDFIRTIANYTGIALDNALAHHELVKSATRDYLTNLLNRKAFNERATYHTKVANRAGSSLSIAISDIDYFKSINDSFGHECGDLVLQNISRIFESNIREQDVVARWGGEEFIFMFPNTDVSGAVIVINKLRELLKSSPITYNDNLVAVSATFGVAKNDRVLTFHEVINRADEALYRGKNNGRDQVCVYD